MNPKPFPKAHWLAVCLLALTALLPGARAWAQDGTGEIPPAVIQNDEGGAVVVRGEMNYTNPEFTMGVSQPVIILEDQAGFVDRNYGYLMPRESQVLGAITGDFFSPPFTWTVSLPIEPQAGLRDVDNDGEQDKGVMTYAVAYWENTFGDPYLEQRDLSGGGWSTAYATTRIKPNPSGAGEVVGGKYLVWAPDDQQGFPSGFGPDGKLFTADDPIVRLPAGYTVVDLDADPFTFDRSREPVMDLIEPPNSALDDYSGLSYTDAFDALVKQLKEEYAFTEYKGIDWDALAAEYRPRFVEADENEDTLAYRRALRDFTLQIPDAHMSAPSIREDFEAAARYGLGLAIAELEDGRVVATFVTPDGPADQAGIAVGAEILEMNGQPVGDFVSQVVPYSGPFGTASYKRLQQLRYATRAPKDAEVAVKFQNPDASEAQTATLGAEEENESFRFTSFLRGVTGTELPVEFELLPQGIGYVKLNSFSDNSVLTVQLWETMLQTLNSFGIPALVIDMRQNGGGSGFLADQMAAYFFDKQLELGNSAIYDDERGDFYADPNRVERFYLPDESLRYPGAVAIIVGPQCLSACEFFSYDMTLADRAQIVGHYPTGGAGGPRIMVAMPDGVPYLVTIGRATDMSGTIHIEGKGVAPTVRVPMTEETVFYEGDALLDAALAAVTGQPLPFGAEEVAAQPAAEATPSTEATAAPTAAPAVTEVMTETAATAEPVATEVVTETAAPAAPAATEVITETAVPAEPVATAEPAATPEPAETPEAAATPETAAPAEATGQTATIVTSGGRALVRQGPSGLTPIVGAAANGNTYAVLEVSADGQWVRIDFGPDGGWVAASLVQIGD
jgi:C-terminal processing protease CtpA/Prc